MPINANVLIHLLDSPNEFDRRGAAQELGQLPVSNAAVFQALQRSAQNDKSERVRQAAKAALKTPAQQAVRPLLPASAPAEPSRPASRKVVVVGNLMYRLAITSLLIDGMYLWLWLANGYSLPGLLLLIHGLLTSGALFVSVRWLDQGRRSAVLLSGAVVIFYAILALVIEPLSALPVVVFDIIYVARIVVPAWRSGELK